MNIPVAYRWWSSKWHDWQYTTEMLDFPNVPAGTVMEPLYLPLAHQTNPFPQPEPDTRSPLKEKGPQPFGSGPSGSQLASEKIEGVGTDASVLQSAIASDEFEAVIMGRKVRLSRYVWNLALEEAAYACDQLNRRAGDADECADAIRSMKK